TIKSESSATSRFVMLLLSGFAVLAMVLAAVGIYGVVAFSVAERRREMGIRAALGATGSRLLGLALRSSLLFTAAGLAIGALGIQWTGKLLTTLLFHTEATEAPTLVAVAVMLALVAFAASLIPGIRAARVDPATALRHE